MQAINFLLDFAFDAVVTLFIVRIWLQLVRADFYNPISQFVVKLTNPVVAPCRRVIPSIGNLDTATVLLAFIFSSLKFIVIPVLNGAQFQPFVAMFIGALALVKQTGVILFIMMFIMAIMSFVVQGYNPTMMLFQQLTEPFLKPIRNIIPAVGGLDLSVLVAFLILNVINYILIDLIPFWAVI